MPVLNENLTTLVSSKTDIKEALIEKGVEPSGGLTTYAEAIRSLVLGGGSCRVIVPDDSTVLAMLDGVDVTAANMVDGDLYISDLSGNLVVTITRKIFVTYNLTHVSSSNNVSVVANGSTYVATLTPDEGYVIRNISVYMDGINVTSTVVSDNVITIPGVSGNISIEAGAELMKFGVTYNLTNAVSSASVSELTYGDTFNATISAPVGYDLGEVSVTMSGMDVPVSDGVVNISKVTGPIVITANATVQTYVITYNLTHVSGNNAASTATYGSSYALTLTPDEGYDLGTVSVTMGGSPVAANNGVVSISSVTGPIVVTAGANIKVFSITSNLTHTASSNTSASIEYGSSYTTTLTADADYNLGEVVVTMGGTNITATSYNNGVVTIANVTGDISITATSTANSTTVTYNFTSVRSTNTAAETPMGSPYTTTLSSTKNNWSVNSIVVTMNGVDISNSVVSGNVINIPSVSGPIVITASASRAKDIGVVASTTNSITINDGELPAGTYTMRYEDADGNPIPNMNDITTFTI